MPELKWLKSSFSEASGNACVEVAATSPEGISLRESDNPDIVVSTSQPALRALLLGVKAGGVQSPGR
ncbi:DUF397 domain-containing protein [Streptomyces sp. NPDC002994]|uniref:DUF397 domain-containing protein n=1 Tax=Streptomyces sp. NPDC002994 TaxID=3154441 RepID=UPI0033B905EA